jgi:lipopolysaccharide transport system permease protein
MAKPADDILACEIQEPPLATPASECADTVADADAWDGIEILIEPRRGWQPIDLGELWRYRELLWFLALRDIQVRYKQTVLGIAWAVIQPLANMAILAIFFGYFGGMAKDSRIPYPLLTFAALLPWQFFASALTNAGNSLVTNQNLITKVYFPRLAVPIAAVLTGLIDFMIAFVLLIGMMAFYKLTGRYPLVLTWKLLMLPLFMMLALAASLAVGLLLAAINVEYRDVRHTIPFVTQFWFFATPVAYSIQKIPARWRGYCGINPMTGVVEGFRWALFGEARAPGSALGVSVAVTLALLLGGLLYFRRMEKRFADVI